jgi:uncharacterized hydrophobic protein (TIGR00271 family)
VNDDPGASRSDDAALGVGSAEPLTPAGGAVRHGWWRSRSDDEFESSLGELFFEGDDRRVKLIRFESLIVLSAAIAGFGLLADSAGVVIGAMLVAPLMTPIQALGAGLVQGSGRRMLSSALVILSGFVGAVITGYVVAVVGGGGVSVEALPNEILSRTAPALIDLGIAVAAGAAGGYVITRPQVSNALPGVGIAVALVPPLSTVGICLQLGERDLASGAALLFVTNLAAIVLAGAVMIAGAGFRPQRATTRNGRTTWFGWVAAILLVVVVAIPLAVHTRSAIDDSNANQIVDDAIPDWDREVRVVSLDVDDVGDVVKIDLVVTSPSDEVSVWELTRLLRERLGQPVAVELRVQPETVDHAVAG